MQVAQVEVGVLGEVAAVLAVHPRKVVALLRQHSAKVLQDPYCKITHSTHKLHQLHAQ